MPEQTSLEMVLDAACAFAIAHGVEHPIRPGDFGIQRSEDGLVNATFVDSSHAVTVFVDHHGRASFGVAELYWVHHESDEDRDVCDYCEVVDAEGFARPVTTVYLPGDGPSEGVRDVA